MGKFHENIGQIKSPQEYFSRKEVKSYFNSCIVFRLRKRSPTTITSPPMYTNHSNLDGISQAERNSGFTSRSPIGVIVSKQKEVHWNQEAISSQDSFITENASAGKNISPIIPKQCEIKASPASKFNVDNMTTTDTTGSYRSSASNIDVSSTSLQEEGTCIN